MGGDALTVARQSVALLSDAELTKFVFSEDAVSKRVRDAVAACPPDLKPDVNFNDDTFQESCQACNAEMMRRCASLRTAKTRKALAANPGDYVPYVLKANARKNLQKILAMVPLDGDMFSFSIFLGWLTKHSPYDNKFEAGVDKRDALAKMIQQIADSIADPGQANLEVQSALMQPLLASDAAVKTWLPAAQPCSRPCL